MAPLCKGGWLHAVETGGLLYCYFAETINQQYSETIPPSQLRCATSLCTREAFKKVELRTTSPCTEVAFKKVELAPLPPFAGGGFFRERSLRCAVSFLCFWKAKPAAIRLLRISHYKKKRPCRVFSIKLKLNQQYPESVVPSYPIRDTDR